MKWQEIQKRLKESFEKRLAELRAKITELQKEKDDFEKTYGVSLSEINFNATETAPAEEDKSLSDYSKMKERILSAVNKLKGKKFTNKDVIEEIPEDTRKGKESIVRLLMSSLSGVTSKKRSVNGRITKFYAVTGELKFGSPKTQQKKDAPKLTVAQIVRDFVKESPREKQFSLSQIRKRLRREGIPEKNVKGNAMSATITKLAKTGEIARTGIGKYKVV